LNNPTKAFPYLEAMTAAQPEDAKWLQILALAQRGAGKSESAVETFRKCLLVDPQNVWSRNDLAATLSSLGRNREAEQTLREALQIDEDNPYLRVALARALYQQGKREAAEKAAREVLREQPDNGQAKDLLTKIRGHVLSPLERMVAAAYASKDPALFLQAAHAIEDHLRRNPGDLTNRKALGFMYLEKLDDPRAAIPHLEMVVKSSSTDTDWLQTLAHAYERIGQREVAAYFYWKAAARNSRDVWARYHLARTLKELKRPKDAQAVLGQALAIDPKNNHVRMEMAQLARTGGDDASAALLANEVLRNDPSNGEAHVLRGDIYRSDRNFAQAQADYEAVSQSDPYFPSAQAGLTAMKKHQKHGKTTSLSR
jgi:predicted Zn-dependent protease